MGYKELSPKNFTNGKINKNIAKKGLIFFSQSWCGFCKQAKPIFKEFAKMSGQNGYLADGEVNKSIFQELGIQGIPDIRIMDENGNIGKKYQGERTPMGFKNFVIEMYGGKRKNMKGGCGGCGTGMTGGRKKKENKKKSIRKHSGINKTTGRLKKGYKYSGKTLKSGLKQIIKL